MEIVKSDYCPVCRREKHVITAFKEVKPITELKPVDRAILPQEIICIDCGILFSLHSCQSF